ncbi:MAG: fimbrillin family protein [Alistipes sp.]|nr:fimbrillin family protein [Alistipes sp.]
MKKLFTILAVAAAMVSCAKEEVVSFDQGEAIEFGSFVDNATRAEQATDPSYTTTGENPNLTSFNVYGAVNGVNIFNGNLVEKKTAGYGDVWSLTGSKQYWIDGADYEFVAVVDGNKKVGENVITSTTLDANSGIPTSITYNIDGATDLLCAHVVREDNTDKSVVAFNFTHLLSKVKFSVTNTTDAAANNYRIVLTEAKITGVYSTGSYGVATKAWTASSTTDYTLENLTINSNATQYHSSEVLLIPGNNVGVVVKAKVQATADGQNWKDVSTIEKTFTNVLGTDGKLVANNAYHFAVTLGIGTEIQFTATTMPEWGNGNTHDSDSDTVNDYIPLQ